jgi:hypothetical protein
LISVHEKTGKERGRGEIGRREARSYEHIFKGTVTRDLLQKTGKESGRGDRRRGDREEGQ